MPGHSVPLAALGGFILLFGFLAFNGGSQVILKVDHGLSIAERLHGLLGRVKVISDYWKGFL